MLKNKILKQIQTRKEPLELADEAPKIKSNDPIILDLWVMSGGRCEFHGCNEYLLQDKLTTNKAKLANIAHIVAISKSGPRGDDSLPLSERNKIGNLMLVCTQHHKLIDDKNLVAKYPKDLLIKYKQEHERGIKYLTNLGPEAKTVIVRMIGDIRGDVVAASDESVRRAVLECAGRYPEYFLSAENNIEINLTQLPNENSEVYWKSGKEKIEEVISRQIVPSIKDKKIRHLSIFGLARIPFLIYFGNYLGDKVPADIYQKHRVGDEGWIWGKEGETVNFKSVLVQKGSDDSKIALVVSISGKISVNVLPREIRNDFTVYEISPNNIEPGRNILRLKSTIDSFRNAYQKLLREIEKSRCVKEMHLFSAIPAPIAIVCGRELMKDVSPSLLVYDKIENEYKLITKIN